jgi:hypothetical protein
VAGWDWQARTYPGLGLFRFEGEVAVHPDLSVDEEGAAGAAYSALAGVGGVGAGAQDGVEECFAFLYGPVA